MRICASLGSVEDAARCSGRLTEVRADMFDIIPDGLDPTSTVLTFGDSFDAALMPHDFRGLVDVGSCPRPDICATVLSSYHDHSGTPDSDTISGIMNGMTGDIAKGAFTVRGFSDLAAIYDASAAVKRKHILIGMGDMGTVTRLRSGLLGNEFTFAYVSRPTAPGQLSIDEMDRLGDDCMITGIVGHPLTHSLSEAMHTEAFIGSGIRGKYIVFDTPSLDGIEDAVRDYGIRGLNVTMPHKKDVIGHLDRVDRMAEGIGAVNTIVNDHGRLTGTNTDAAGIEAAFLKADTVFGEHVLIMGSGGSARACAYVMTEDGSDVSVIGRNAASVRELTADLGCRAVTDADPSKYDTIVNCTPVGMYADAVYPVRIGDITRAQTVFDVVYGTETPLMRVAVERRSKLVSGADMLAGQGAESFRLWTGRSPSFETMRRVIP